MKMQHESYPPAR